MGRLPVFFIKVDNIPFVPNYQSLDEPANEIAELLGFNSASRFSVWFKKRVRKTPDKSHIKFAK